MTNVTLTTKSHTKTAIILFGHGSRDALWHLPIQAVAERIRITSPNTTVTCAYLELTEPSLPDAAAGLIDHGCVRHHHLAHVFRGWATCARRLTSAHR